MSELKTLAQVVTLTYSLREGSYEPSTYDTLDTGERVPTGGGFYKLSYPSAAEAACKALGVDERYAMPAVLMLHYPNDALGWAGSVLAEDAGAPDADAAALVDAAAYAQSLGKF